jgi:catechol 2,3-dioxygenase-like lactoylglutathione lyase family enzyme
MKLAQTILYVQDVEQAAAFYERVFELERGEVNPEGVFIALKRAGSSLFSSWIAYSTRRPMPQTDAADASSPPDGEARFTELDRRGTPK